MFFHIHSIKCWSEIHYKSDSVASIDESWLIKFKRLVYFFSGQVFTQSRLGAEGETLRHELMIKTMSPKSTKVDDHLHGFYTDVKEV